MQDQGNDPTTQDQDAAASPAHEALPAGPTLACAVAGVCGGCAWITRPYAAQLEDKRASLRAAWSAAGLDPARLGALPIHGFPGGKLRDRTDLAFQREQGRAVLGLWDIAHQAIVDIGPCPQAHPALQAWIERLRADPPPVDRATLRLRVSPAGALGLWIDAANIDIKALLDEGSWLRRRQAEAHVELGQRRKPLVDVDGQLKLHKEPELRPWFGTWSEDRKGTLRPVPLYGPIGGFTQAGLRANRVLVERVLAMASAAGVTRWLELGAGNGNFTLPLACRAEQVYAVEMDDLAREGLLRSRREAGLEARITVRAANMHRGQEIGPFLAKVDGVLCDPPRSGLLGFVDALAAQPAESRPRALVYVSCFTESFVADAARLAACGYQLVAIEGVDQFAHSPHCEWVARFTRA